MPDEVKNIQKEMNELKELIIEKTTKLQDEGKSTQAENAETKAKMDKISEDITSHFVKFDELKAKLETEEKARKDLEVALSKRQETPRGDEKAKIIGDAELKNVFRSVVFSNDKVAVGSELREKTMVEVAEAYVPHLPADEIKTHVKSMMVGSNQDGGYWCPVEMVAKIIERMYETSPMRSIANVITTLRERVVFPTDDDDMGFAWAGELDKRNKTKTPQIGEIEIPTHEGYAYVDLTLQVLEDSTQNIEQWLSRKAGRRFGRGENHAFINGNGIKKPEGILSYGEWSNAGEYEAGKFETKLTTGAGAISADDLIDIQAMLFDDFVPGASWIMARQIFAQICKLKTNGATGDYLINPKLLFEGYTPKILGSKVVMMQDMPKTLATNAKAVGYGDFKEGYTIVDRLGISMIKDVVTNPGFVHLYFRKRVGGKAINFDAIKMLKVR